MAPVYVLDACVLYPVVLRDLLLSLAALDAFEPRWTEAILDEMTRNVLADHPGIDPAQFDARLVGAMRQAFPVASVEGYEHVIDAMDNHQKDRARRGGSCPRRRVGGRHLQRSRLRQRVAPTAWHRDRHSTATGRTTRR